MSVQPGAVELDRPPCQRSHLTKTEAADAVHWVRQGTSLILGIVWGAVPITGLFGFLSFLTLSMSVVFVYVMYLLKLEGDFESKMSLLTDGLMPAIAAFLLSWIVSFTLIQY